MSSQRKASPNNKKDGMAYLQTFTKEKLIERCIDMVAQNTDLQVRYDKLTDENIELRKENETYRKRLDRFTTKSEIVKRILEYKARNLVPTIIREKMELEGFEVSLIQIKNIYNGELSLENEAYYKKCVEEYSETIRIDTKYYKQSSIDDINRLLGYAYEAFENCDPEDIKMRMSIMDSISQFIEKRDKLMKNIDENNGNTQEEEILNKTMEDYKIAVENFITISKENMSIIGDDIVEQ